MSFFAYNPRKVRYAFIAGAAACALLAAWALQNASTGAEPFGEARAGVAGGLMLAFAYAAWRIRARAGWGLRLEGLELSVCRPMSGTVIEIPRSQVEMARRDGRRQDTVVLYLTTGRRIVISQHLFPSKAAFDEAARALKNWAPEPQWDA